MFKRFLFVLLCIVSVFSLSKIVFGKDDVAERLDTVVNFDGQKTHERNQKQCQHRGNDGKHLCRI